MLCGNKIDLNDKRCISDSEGKKFTEKFFADFHFTVSAKTNEGMD